MTREEQIAAARRIAEDNPEWTWDEQFEELRFGGAVVYNFTGSDCRARTHGARRSSKHPTPAAAVKALGFTINERST